MKVRAISEKHLLPGVLPYLGFFKPRFGLRKP